MSVAHSALEPTRHERELLLRSRNQSYEVPLHNFTFLENTEMIEFLEDTEWPTLSSTSSHGFLRSPFPLPKMCDNDEDCLDNEEALLANNLHLPTMTEIDGCFETGYNWHRCLLKTTSGLLEFQIYLEYIQNHLSDDQKDTARDIQSNSKFLVQILKQEIKNPDEIVFPNPTAKASLMEKLESQERWLKVITVHLILRSLQDFLQYALRATRQR
uniref:interleukin-6-like n=1 Tax=Jaculus jaculus TaxID=51337 RepID=UPI001E1AFF15|nr:interleukin-6-like [Jaculus jaculus]